MKTPRPGDEIWVQDYFCPACTRQEVIGYATELEVLKNPKCPTCGGKMNQCPAPKEPT